MIVAMNIIREQERERETRKERERGSRHSKERGRQTKVYFTVMTIPKLYLNFPIEKTNSLLLGRVH